MSESNENNQKIKLSTETQELIDSTTKEDVKKIEKIQNLQKEHEKEKDELRETISGNEDKIIEVGKEKERLKTELMKEQNEKKALREALLQQKQKFSTLTEPEERLSYGDKVSKGAYELILKRCKTGYYGGEPCRECKISVK